MNRSNNNREYYDILEVDRKASKEEIDQAYKKLARKWHPDKNRDNQQEATEMFQKISGAYKTLSDPKSRQIYDMYGKDGVGQIPQQDGPSPQKCKPILHQLAVSLKDLYLNSTIIAKFPCKNSCNNCDGTGSKSRQLHKCDQCHGMGHVMKMIRMGPMIQQMLDKCGKCKGKGSDVPQNDMCPTCSGKGYCKGTGSVDITLDSSNMDWGIRMQVPNKGHQLRDMIPGDVVIELIPTDDPDQKFKRIGKKDLQINVPISLSMALTGVNVMIETLDGRWLRIHLNEIVTPKTSKMIPNEGMLLGNNQGTKRGNLYINFDIEFPISIKPNHVQNLKKALGNSSIDKEYNALFTTNKDKITATYNKLDDYLGLPEQDSDDDEGELHFGGPPQCAQQ